MSKPDMILFLNDSHGQYIPQNFVDCIALDRLTGVKVEDLDILRAGPDHEWYWDAWENVCQNAIITDANGVKYTIWQDGDCWLIPEGMEWDDKTQTFTYPEDKAEEDEPEHDGQPDEAQEWHDFDPDC